MEGSSEANNCKWEHIAMSQATFCSPPEDPVWQRLLECWGGEMTGYWTPPNSVTIMKHKLWYKLFQELCDLG